MKPIWMLMLFTASVLLASLSSGCGHKNAPKAGEQSVDEAFATAKPELKEAVAKGEALVKAKDYAGAFQEFYKLSNNEQLTAEQRQAVMNTLHTIAQKVPSRDPGVAPATTPR